MSEQVIRLSDNAAARIKQIMSKAENSTIGVRVGVKSGWLCWNVIQWNMQKKLSQMKKL